MTLFFTLLWAFIWNLIGATIGLIPLGTIFLISKGISRAINFIKGFRK